MAHDHSGHDMGHSGHNHAGHTTEQSTIEEPSHGSMSHGGMTFHWGYTEKVLFDFWNIESVGAMVASVIGIVIMAALYEGLKYYREYLFWKTYNTLQYRSVTMPQEKNVVSENSQVVHVVGEVIHKQPPTMFSWMHIFQTGLHIVQVIISYFLMLIFMTFNYWLCLGVVLGTTIGYFLFGWKKSVIVDVTEHCH